MLRSTALLLSASALCLAAPHAVAVKGCVAKEGELKPAAFKGLPLHRRLVKVADAKGVYRCTIEVEGYSVNDVLNRLDVKKKTNDGFDRPLDLFLTAEGRTGHKAVFSYCEVAMAGDGGPLLVEKSRLVLPHHHDPLKAGANDPTILLGPARRDGLKLESCTSCHGGEKPPALSVPKGWLLLAPADGFGGRFVEDVAAITLHQAGSSVVANKEGTKNTVIETPDLVGVDGAKAQLTAELFAKAAPMTYSDATFGMGRGFHGMRTWVGTDLGALLRPLVPAGVDPGRLMVMITAADGYRVAYSGHEVFKASEGRGIMIADRINKEPLGPGSGKYHVFSKADFYIDRDVRMVKEIRLSLVK